MRTNKKGPLLLSMSVVRLEKGSIQTREELLGWTDVKAAGSGLRVALHGC